MITLQQLSGAWVLEDFTLFDPLGISRPWGRNARGLLIYGDAHQMSVSINKDIEESENGPAQDILDAMLFYSGSYRLEGESVIHQVNQASDPERMGKELLRFAKLAGDLLELSSPLQPWGRAVLRWRRLP